MYNSDDAIRSDILDSWEMLDGASESFIDENLNQWADNAIPIYNNDIMKDWAEMPSEFDDSWQEFGAQADSTIISLMQIDLWHYYQDAYQRIYQEVLAEELRLAEEGEDA